MALSGDGMAQGIVNNLLEIETDAGTLADLMTDEQKAQMLDVWKKIAGAIVAHIQAEGTALMANHVHGGVVAGGGVTGKPSATGASESLR